jgi:poly(3-hydroxybutyrate) depolymerase
VSNKDAWQDGRLLARPGKPARVEPPEAGTSVLGMRRGRDGLLHVPLSVRPEVAAPLLIMLDGAGGMASHVVSMVADQA